MTVERRRCPAEVAVLLLTAGLAEAVRASGWLASALLYTFALSGLVLDLWLFVLSG